MKHWYSIIAESKICVLHTAEWADTAIDAIKQFKRVHKDMYNLTINPREVLYYGVVDEKGGRGCESEGG